MSASQCPIVTLQNQYPMPHCVLICQHLDMAMPEPHVLKHVRGTVGTRAKSKAIARLSGKRDLVRALESRRNADRISVGPYAMSVPLVP
eukprot:206770-Rhodomonas_salina.1